MLVLWLIIFVVSLFLLVKGADWLLENAEKIGLYLGISPFIIGVTIVGIGTSFPELISGIAAAIKEATEIVTANAIGSNIANILLIVGLSAVLAKRLSVTKNLIDIDLPLLSIATVIFLATSQDKIISRTEAVFLIIVYGIYLLYTIYHIDTPEEEEYLPSRVHRRHKQVNFLFPLPHLAPPKKISFKNFLMAGIGIVSLALGAKYLIDSVIKISAILNIATEVISLAAVAIGTSLPELLVSAKAAWQKKSEVALGNIFGSNAFNLLGVAGIPALIRPLAIDPKTYTVGIPILIAATFLFVISGISRRIYLWEGGMYLVLYVFFIAKLFAII